MSHVLPLEVQRLGRLHQTWRDLIRRNGGIENTLAILNGPEPQQKTPPVEGGVPGRTAIRPAEKDMKIMTAVSLFAKGSEPPISEGRFVVSPPLAEYLLANHNYHSQRRIDAAHVTSLAASMRRRGFLPGSQIAFGRLDGALHLVNGQHRLHAIVESGCAVEFQVVIIDCPTEDALTQLYYTFDRHGRARSDADVLAAVGITQKYGLSATAARAVWQAAPIIENRFQRVPYAHDPDRRDDDRRLQICREWWPVAAVYEESIKKAPAVVRKRLLTAQAMAVALAVFKHRPHDATEFFEGLAADDGLRRDDPRKALLIDLPARVWARQSLDGCIIMSYAWNAFFKRRPLAQLKIPQNARIRLEGTPYDGSAA